MPRVISKLVAKITETLLPYELVSRIRTGREWKRWIKSLTPEILENLMNAPLEVKQRIFKKYVRRVEIETHARCNRICSFCPNVIVDRRQNQTITDPEMLHNVFKELGSIDYESQVVFARYSEPLANKAYLYEQIACARKLLPHAELAITTNTDYLTSEVLDQMLDAGLNVVYMSLYLKPNGGWTLDLANAYNDRLVKKLNLRLLTRRESPLQLQCTYKYKGLDLCMFCSNWEVYGVDRGNSIQQYSKLHRLGPCRDLFETFVVDYTGAVMPCCNLRSDLPQHRDFILGNLLTSDTSIFNIFTEQAAEWRRRLISFGEKAFPCTTCLHRDIPKALVPSIATSLEEHLRRINCMECYKLPVDMPRSTPCKTF